MNDFTTVDLAAADAAAGLDKACRDLGLFYLVGHGIPDALIEEVTACSRAFFALDPAEKARVAQPASDCIRGHIGFGKAALAATQTLPTGSTEPADLAADFKESFNMGPPMPREAPAGVNLAVARAHGAANLWPVAPAGFRAAWQAAYQAFEALSERIFRLQAQALDLPAAQFADKTRNHVSVFGAILYPPRPADRPAGQVRRAGAHRDFGSFSILRVEAGRQGLEVEDGDGIWRPVPTRGGALVVVLGEMTPRWTAGRWRAPLHRVVEEENPPAGAAGRLTLGYFQHPDLDAAVAPLPGLGTPEAGPPACFGDLLHDRFSGQQAAAERTAAVSGRATGTTERCS